MKIKKTYFVLALLIIIAAAMWFVRRPKKQESPQSQPVATATTPSNPKAHVAASNPTANQSTVAIVDDSKNTSIPADILAKYRQGLISKDEVMKQMVESKNIPVAFFGKVVDQDGQPIAGADVTLGVNHNIYVIPGSPESKIYEAMSAADLQRNLNPTTKVTTDTDGRFQWVDAHTTGDGLGVGTIRKDGYELEPGQYSFGMVSGIFDNPIIFKMWSTNIHEQLITGEKEFEILPDSRPHVIDLTKGTIDEPGSGDLRVWIQYTNQVTKGQLYDWSAGIEVINGGLLEEPHGTVMYYAPTDGYAPSFSLHQQIKGGQSGKIGDRSFYLTLKNGQEYGKIDINLYAPYGYLHPGLIRLSYAINPSGSRILR